MRTTYTFQLPKELNATCPPEKRGLRRDGVKLMVLNKQTGAIDHDCFYNLDQYLNKGDLLIVNNSRTIPALLKADWYRGQKFLKMNCEIRLARQLNEREWDVIIPQEGIQFGDIFHFSNNVIGKVTKVSEHSPFKRMEFTLGGVQLLHEIYKLGEPIRYEYIHQPYLLEDYQTVFGSIPGSMEMPSAGRAFTWELLEKLKRKGVQVASIILHTGLSYYLDDKWDHSPSLQFEEFVVPPNVIKQIQETKNKGNKVIAVGTTVIRAVETAIHTGKYSGWTNLYIDRDFKIISADGIITGFHEPEASHLHLLSSFVPESFLMKAYEEAIKHEYYWHEFGDMNLII